MVIARCNQQTDLGGHHCTEVRCLLRGLGLKIVGSCMDMGREQVFS
jgi:hypothetical protein